MTKTQVVATMPLTGYQQELLTRYEETTAEMPESERKDLMDGFKAWLQKTKPVRLVENPEEINVDAEPAPRQESFVERLRRERRAGASERAERYRCSAAPYCKRYNLDAEQDRRKIDALIEAARLMEKCQACTSLKPLACRRCGIHDYETAKVDKAGNVRWIPCRVATERAIWEILPEKYAGKTWDDYVRTSDNAQAIGAAQWFVKGGEKSLYIWGNCGTGKTFLASLIAKEIIRQGQWVMFGDVPTLLDEIKMTFNDPTTSSQKVLRRYLKCDLLILDDVGTGKLSDWNVGILYQIINGRYSDEKPTVLTSNYGIDEFTGKFSRVDDIAAQRIESRLRGMCHFVKLGGEDWRLK